MDAIITRLAAYSDDRGNEIVHDGERDQNIWIRFKGSSNRLVVAKGIRLKALKVFFDCDNATVEVGTSTRGTGGLDLTVRVGQDSTVKVGRDVTSTSRVFLSATEGTTVIIGNDVMFATGNEVRADDAHPIFDVHSGKRVNVSRSVRVGNHVWLAREAVVLSGVTIGDGAVIGYRSLVTRSIPNNCIAVGVPAVVTRRDVAWERPHLSEHAPFYKPDASTVTKSPYWHATSDPQPTKGAGQPKAPPTLRRRVRSRLGRAARRLGLRR